MSQASSKKSFGFYIVLLAAVLALAAGVYFLVIHGTFGLDSTHNGDCYDPIITGLLIGGAAVAVILSLIKNTAWPPPSRRLPPAWLCACLCISATGMWWTCLSASTKSTALIPGS